VGLFDRVEHRLERAVNGAFARAFKSVVQPVEIASAIRRAMDDRAASGSQARSIVPNLFTVELSGTDYDRLARDEAALQTELIAAAEEHAETQRYQPGGALEVHFCATDDLETGVFRLRTSTARRTGGGPGPSTPPPAPRHTSAAVGVTQRQPAVGASPRINPADRPWLDIDGERYPLMGPITVLGRDDSADIILDDPGVSRRHSEVRVTHDGPHLVVSIRDLDSTNGTFVNGERVSSQRLSGGDQVTVGRTSATFRAGRR
jgi:hypothetical protein